jgi:hypothetical protein
MTSIPYKAEIRTNTGAKPKVVLVGSERTPIVVIDEFLEDLTGLNFYACTEGSFEQQRTAGYPGVRSGLPNSYVDEALSVCIPLIREVYKVPAMYRYRRHHAFFSLTCMPEADLAIPQRMPHVDTQRPHYFAILHYLNPHEYGGTGFYQHRPTGYERITERRYHHYFLAVKQFMMQNGFPENRYCRSSDDHYELIDKVDYVFNRLVIYPGNLLHSGMISPNRDLSSNPEKGRLTANIFIDFDEAN